MTDKNKPPKGGRLEESDELSKYGNKATKGLFNSKNNSYFNENELASGSTDLLEKTDAELFPKEVDEYTRKERKPRIIVNNEPRKPRGQDG